MYTIFKVCASGHTEVKEIGEDLHSLQAEVGGSIKTVRLFEFGDPLLIVNNKEKLMDLPENTLIPGINGDGFFIGTIGEEFIGLTSGQISKLKMLFEKTTEGGDGE